MTTTSGLAVVAVTEVRMFVAWFSEALRLGRSAYSVVPSGRLDYEEENENGKFSKLMHLFASRTWSLAFKVSL